MTLDKATADLLAAAGPEGQRRTREMTLAESRSVFGPIVEAAGRGPEMVWVDDRTITTPDAEVPVRVLVPREHSEGVIVYFHGGGWVIGHVDAWDAAGRIIAERTGCTVVLVEYRRAPEDPFPAAIDDAWHVTRWAASHLEEIAGGVVPLIVAGDSAGGNLAAVVAQRAARARAPAVALQVLVYPVTDADFDRPSYLDPDNQLSLDRDDMRWLWDCYVPDVGRRSDPDAAPLRAPDLSGLPPAVVVVAEHDILRDEGEAYASRLREAGVPVTERLFEGQMHGFFTLINILPGSAAAIDFVTGAISGQLAELKGTATA